MRWSTLLWNWHTCLLKCGLDWCSWCRRKVFCNIHKDSITMPRWVNRVPRFWCTIQRRWCWTSTTNSHVPHGKYHLRRCVFYSAVIPMTLYIYKFKGRAGSLFAPSQLLSGVMEIYDCFRWVLLHFGFSYFIRLESCHWHSLNTIHQFNDCCSRTFLFQNSCVRFRFFFFFQQ